MSPFYPSGLGSKKGSLLILLAVSVRAKTAGGAKPRMRMKTAHANGLVGGESSARHARLIQVRFRSTNIRANVSAGIGTLAAAPPARAVFQTARTCSGAPGGRSMTDSRIACHVPVRW